MTESNQEQIWVARAQEGDPLAISKLLAKHHPLLRARTEARMDPPLKVKYEPEDLLQEVYLDVFQHIDRFKNRGPNSFLNWVLTVLESKLTDAHRTLHSRKRDVDREIRPRTAGGTESYWNLLDQLYADPDTPSRVARREEAVGALLSCLSGLSNSHRQVIQLRFLQGCTVNEAADHLARSPAAVVALTKAALKSLRRSMDRLGDFTRGV